MGGLLTGLTGLAGQIVPAYLGYKTQGRQLKADTQLAIARDQAAIASSARTTRTLIYAGLGAGVLFLAARRLG